MYESSNRELEGHAMNGHLLQMSQHPFAGNKSDKRPGIVVRVTCVLCQRWSETGDNYGKYPVDEIADGLRRSFVWPCPKRAELTNEMPGRTFCERGVGT